MSNYIGTPVDWVHRGDYTRKSQRWLYTQPRPQISVGSIINTVIMACAVGCAIVVGMYILMGL